MFCWCDSEQCGVLGSLDLVASDLFWLVRNPVLCLMRIIIYHFQETVVFLLIYCKMNSGAGDELVNEAVVRPPASMVS